ncbi:hypothetical protein MSUIS_00400 [Mycoplasma suis KI3806]|uniref:Uncharacterized protein n=1 Tax=Mycoplasma suis (strain KI_3806) TaxID=708248 RepID=F0V2R1_MYCS3|nr:hypothetical protein [Mycoplasma suis]CBZ40133.1 hypothetical protein MSUIS_00400 [Mycoplasma suis KI3806]
MALLSLSAKIVFGLMASVVGSGVIVGTVVATSNKGIINNVEGEKPSSEVSGSDGSSSENEDKADLEKDKTEDEAQETKGEKGSQPSEEIGPKSPEPEISPEEEKSDGDQSFQENNPISSPEERHDELLGIENGEESDDDQDSVDLLEQQEGIDQLQVSDDFVEQEETEESKKLREDAENEEFENIGVKLEVVWIYQSVGKDRMCFLSKTGAEKSTPVLIDLLDNEEEGHPSADECDQETTWSGNRDVSDLKDNKEAIWVRGEEEKVKEFIDKNWESSLKASRYVTKNKPQTDEERIKELKLTDNSCELSNKEIGSRKMLELSCILKEYNFNRK